MDDALTIHRLHFAFTITYHYLFPQLTMGLALLIVVLKTVGLTVEAAAAGAYGLRGALWWWIPGMLLVGGYFVYTYRHFAGKVSLDEGEEH